VPVVDSHCHVSSSWYEPVEVLLFQMERNGVDHASLIQMNAQADNRYQHDCVRRYPGKFASVVFIHPDDPASVAQLEREAGEGASGVRIGPGAPMALWEQAARLKLSVSCGGSGPLFASDQFAKVLESFPDIPIVIEHLGGLNRPGPDDGTRQKVLGLARFPNAHMKIHGLGEFSQRAMPAKEPLPFVEPIPPLLDLAYEAFGPSRLMWGSDYPPVSSREGYTNSLAFTRSHLQSRSGLEEIFGATALRVFPVR
jgi:L-fuconolactonase